MRRTILLAVLSLLLLAMQQEGQLHSLSHLDSQAARAHDTGLAVPHDSGTCAECALLAAGSSGVAGNGAVFAFVSPVGERVVSGFRSRAADTPSYFSSRAPPVLL
jgi:hypothetical protein